jgi:hypothetical protein
LHRARRRVAYAVLAAAAWAVIGPAATAHPDTQRAASIGRPVSDLPPASPSRLWLTRRGRWLHQDATVFNVYATIHSARLRYWLVRALGDWSRYTMVEMRLVNDRAWANVVALEGSYGKRRLRAWTSACLLCQRSAIYFNRDRLVALERRPHANTVLRALTCHEVGHVLGLGHGGGDCMSYSYQRTRTLGIGPGSVRLVDYAYRYVTPGLPRWLAARGTT